MSTEGVGNGQQATTTKEGSSVPRRAKKTEMLKKSRTLRSLNFL